jgi:Tfp pilus assembly protein PilV
VTHVVPASGGIQPRSRDAGFSAVELMISIVFFGILMLGFLAVFPLGTRTVQKGERMTVASSLAQDELERLKTVLATDPDLVAGAHADPANPINGAYNRTWTVTDDTPLPDMKRVDMQVSFSDNGIQRNIQMSTYLNP